MKPSALVILVLAGFMAAVAGEAPSSADLLERSIEYHDPNDVWSSRTLEFVAEVKLAERLAAERGYAVRTDRISIDNATGAFRYRSDRGEEQVDESGEGRYKNYFTYVLGVPMKLRDPGTRLDPRPTRTEFAGRDAWSVRVTYDSDVGGDTWYFYFHPETAALLGCRFFHDEAANDGEFIVYEDEIEGPDGLRLPRLRLWHMNTDDEYIASDEILSID